MVDEYIDCGNKKEHCLRNKSICASFLTGIISCETSKKNLQCAVYNFSAGKGKLLKYGNISVGSISSSEISKFEILL